MTISPTYSYAIIVCETCNGDGVMEHEELTNYHKREYDYTYSLCHRCEGSGLLKQKTTVELEPHKPKIHLAESNPYKPRKW